MLASIKTSIASFVSGLELQSQVEPAPRDGILVARLSPRPSVSGGFGHEQTVDDCPQIVDNAVRP